MSGEKDPGLSFGRRLTLVAAVVGAGAASGCGIFEEESPPRIPGEVSAGEADCDPLATTAEVESIDEHIEQILCRELWEHSASVVEVYQDRDDPDITSREMRVHNDGIELRYIAEPRHLYISAIFAPDESGDQPDLGRPQEFEIREIIRGENTNGSFIGTEKTRIRFDAATESYAFEDERITDDGMTERVAFTGQAADADILAAIQRRLEQPIAVIG